MAIHRRSSERGILAFSRDLAEKAHRHFSEESDFARRYCYCTISPFVI
jgi:hypothetical protein